MAALDRSAAVHRNASNQIAAVIHPSVQIRPQKILNKGEATLFYAAKDVLKQLKLERWHVLAQVSLGELLRAEGTAEWRRERAWQSINSKRSDVVIADNYGMPVMVLEYQGSGHYQGNARMRDAVKKIAVERAGIAFIEIGEEMDKIAVRERLFLALRPLAAQAEGKPRRPELS